MEIGGMIKQKRQEAGLTMQELSDQVGCSKALMSQIENGRSVDTTAFSTVARIAFVLGIEIDSLIDHGSLKRALKASDTIVRKYPFTIGHSCVTVSIMTRQIYNLPLQWLTYKSRAYLLMSCPPVLFALNIIETDNAPEYLNDDQIFIDPEVPPRPGEMVIAELDALESGVLRKYRPRGIVNGEEIIELVPLNDDYPTYTISPDSPGRIIGPVVRTFATLAKREVNYAEKKVH